MIFYLILFGIPVRLGRLAGCCGKQRTNSPRREPSIENQHTSLQQMPPTLERTSSGSTSVQQRPNLRRDSPIADRNRLSSTERNPTLAFNIASRTTSSANEASTSGANQSGVSSLTVNSLAMLDAIGSVPHTPATKPKYKKVSEQDPKRPTFTPILLRIPSSEHSGSIISTVSTPSAPL